MTVNTMQRIPYSTILKPVALDNIQQRTSLAMRNIVKTDLLLITRNLLINLLKQRNQFVNESLPFPGTAIHHYSPFAAPKVPAAVDIRLLLRFSAKHFSVAKPYYSWIKPLYKSNHTRNDHILSFLRSSLPPSIRETSDGETRIRGISPICCERRLYSFLFLLKCFLVPR